MDLEIKLKIIGLHCPTERPKMQISTIAKQSPLIGCSTKIKQKNKTNKNKGILTITTKNYSKKPTKMGPMENFRIDFILYCF